MKTMLCGLKGLIPLSSFAAALLLSVAGPIASATTYYVSPSGNDSNNGTSPSTPWKTIAKVNAASFTGGDSLLFQGGQTFTGSIKFARANVTSTPSSKFTVGAYGTGRPTIISTKTNINSYAISVEGVSGIVIQDLIVRPGATSAQNGILVRNDYGAVPNDITIQGCDVGGFHYAPTNFGAEIFVNGYWGSLNNIKILDNVLHGLNGPSSPDDNGFSSLGNGKNIKNLTVQGNIVYDIGGTATGGPLSGSLGNGILANGVDGGILQDNIVHDCGGNTDTCGGPGGIWAYNSNDVTIQFNEVYRMQPLNYTDGCDWSAYDLDGGTTNCVVQYNYSHDNFGPGLLAYVDGTWGPNVFRYNISENDDYGHSEGNHAPVSIAGEKVGGVLQIYNNTIYDGSDHSTENTRKVLLGPHKTGTWGAGSMIKNNIFYIASKSKYNNVDVIYFPEMPQNNLTIDNNVYYNTVAATPRWRWDNIAYTSFSTYQTQTGHDANSLTSDPLLVAPGTGGTLSWDPTAGNGPQPEPSGYALQPSSPLFGLGAYLGSLTPAAGPRDYYNYSTPNGLGSGYNIGADGGNLGGIVYEAENETSTQSDSVSVVNNVEASGGQLERLNSDAVNDYITYTLPVTTAGDYEIIVGFNTYSTRGKFQLSIDGVDQGLEVDQYSSTLSWTEVSLGTKTFSAGNHSLKFTVTGKNAASANYNLGFDYIELVQQGGGVPSGSVTYEAENETSTESDSVSVVNNVEASGGQLERLNSDAVDDYITYTLPVTTAGDYEIFVRFNTYSTRGKFQLSIDGVDQGPVVDQYAASGSWVEVSLGTKTLTVGNHAFKFTVVGKNASSANYNLGFDSIELAPPGSGGGSGSALYEVENETSTESDSVSVVNNAQASGGQLERLNSSEVDDYITYTIPVTTAGDYEIFVRFNTYSTRGKFQLSIDGADQGPEVDQYAASGTWEEVSLGTKTLSGGNHAFKFTVTGKNAASANHNLGFDYIELVEQ